MAAVVQALLVLASVLALVRVLARVLVRVLVPLVRAPVLVAAVVVAATRVPVLARVRLLPLLLRAPKQSALSQINQLRRSPTKAPAFFCPGVAMRRKLACQLAATGVGSHPLFEWNAANRTAAAFGSARCG